MPLNWRRYWENRSFSNSENTSWPRRDWEELKPCQAYANKCLICSLEKIWKFHLTLNQYISAFITEVRVLVVLLNTILRPKIRSSYISPGFAVCLNLWNSLIFLLTVLSPIFCCFATFLICPSTNWMSSLSITKELGLVRVGTIVLVWLVLWSFISLPSSSLKWASIKWNFSFGISVWFACLQ